MFRAHIKSGNCVTEGSFAVTEKYKEYGYSAAGTHNGDSERRLAEKIVHLASQLGSVEHVCDLGYGNGYLASRLGASGFRVTGVDASESGVEIANRHYATENVRFAKAEIGSDLLARTLAIYPFDAVVSSDVIEHLYRPAALIEAAASLLKPGGYLIVGTPYHGYLKNLALSVFNKWDSHHGVHWDGGHIKFFSVQTLRELVARNGFVDVQFAFYGRLPWLWKNMICISRRPLPPTSLQP